MSTFLIRSSIYQSSSYTIVLTRLGGPRSRSNTHYCCYCYYYYYIKLPKPVPSQNGKGRGRSNNLFKKPRFTWSAEVPSEGPYLGYTCCCVLVRHWFGKTSVRTFWPKITWSSKWRLMHQASSLVHYKKNIMLKSRLDVNEDERRSINGKLFLLWRGILGDMKWNDFIIEERKRLHQFVIVLMV